MYKLEHTKELDFVLIILHEYPIAFDLNTLSTKLEEVNSSIEFNELRRIVRKLIDDGYVQGNESFSLKFEGHVFAESGGYTSKVLKSEADASLSQSEVDRRRTLDTLLATNSTRLNVLTRWLVIGTLAVVVWQIFLWFFPNHSDYPLIWIWQTMPKKP